MKKIIAASVLSLIAAPAFAHDFWAGYQPIESDKPFVAVLGYGHNFPAGEEVKAEEMGVRFNPPKLIGAQGEIGLKTKTGAEPRLFVTEAPLKKGGYLLAVSQNPAFWSVTPEGSARKNKKEAPGATSCRQSVGFGKALINVGEAKTDAAIYSKVVGQTLEIVPAVDPNSVPVGGTLPVTVLFQGQAIPGADVKAYFAGFSDEGAFAFAGRTDKNGKITIIPLHGGQWLAKATYERPYPDKEVCDQSAYNSTLSFTVAK
ncbi:MAG: DUF4198 domain-containing protein [Desulfobulbaceae bacterium]|jgi:uncharacterized GH25 family protein|nr:DUF4198 domain-containing protein [Desulfobulbaceae bacterium]